MSSITDKLEYSLETKELIKQAIIDKGVDVSDADTLRSYAEKIGEISGGGGSGINVISKEHIKGIIGDELYGLKNHRDTIVINADLTGTYTKRVQHITITNTTSWNAYSTGWYTASAISPTGIWSDDIQSNILANSNPGATWTTADGICIEQSSGRILLWGTNVKNTIGSPASFFASKPLEVIYLLSKSVSKTLTTEQCKKFLSLLTFEAGTTIYMDDADFDVTYKKIDGTTATVSSIDGVLQLQDCATSKIVAVTIRGKYIASGVPNMSNPVHFSGNNIMISSANYGDLTIAEEASF